MDMNLSMEEYINWLGKMRVEVSEMMDRTGSCHLTQVYERLYWIEMDMRDIFKMSKTGNKLPEWQDEPRIAREKAMLDERLNGKPKLKIAP